MSGDLPNLAGLGFRAPQPTGPPVPSVEEAVIDSITLETIPKGSAAWQPLVQPRDGSAEPTPEPKGIYDIENLARWLSDHDTSPRGRGVVPLEERRAVIDAANSLPSMRGRDPIPVPVPDDPDEFFANLRYEDVMVRRHPSQMQPGSSNMFRNVDGVYDEWMFTGPGLWREFADHYDMLPHDRMSYPQVLNALRIWLGLSCVRVMEICALLDYAVQWNDDLVDQAGGLGVNPAQFGQLLLKARLMRLAIVQYSSRVIKRDLFNAQQQQENMGVYTLYLRGHMVDIPEQSFERFTVDNWITYIQSTDRRAVSRFETFTRSQIEFERGAARRENYDLASAQPQAGS